MAKQYFPGVDLLKGILIMLVALGHVLQGSTTDSFLRYAIYSFHMPLFLGVSGFLLTADSLRLTSVGGLLSKYFNRMLLPWLAALVVYTLIDRWSTITTGQAAPRAVLNWVLYPHYQLWFIPSLFVMIVALWAWLKAGWNCRVLLALAGTFTVAWLIVFKGDFEACPKQLYYLGDKRTFTYFIFFLLGFASRNQMLPTLQAATIWAATAMLAAARGATFFLFAKTAADTPAWVDHLAWIEFVLLNTVLVAGVAPRLARLDLRGRLGGALAWMGLNSLFIYLWHDLFRLAGKQWILPNYSVGSFYAVTLPAMVVGLAVIYSVASRTPVLRSLVVGAAARVRKSPQPSAAPEAQTVESST